MPTTGHKAIVHNRATSHSQTQAQKAIANAGPQTHVDTRVFIHIHICVPACSYTCSLTYPDTCLYTCRYMCPHTCPHLCPCTCQYTCPHMYAHTCQANIGQPHRPTMPTISANKADLPSSMGNMARGVTRPTPKRPLPLDTMPTVRPTPV